MWEVFGAGNFDRAYQSSEQHWQSGTFDSQAAIADIAFAKGLLLAVLLMAPFWIAFALLIYHLTE